MSAKFIKKAALSAAFFVVLWLCLRYLLPLLLPFLLGTLLALAAEPAVAFGSNRLKLPRKVSVGIGVTLTLVLLASLLSLLGSFAAREIGRLTDIIPGVERTAKEGITQLRSWMSDLADRSPEGMQPMLKKGLSTLFSADSALLSQASGKALKMVTGVLGRIPDGALGLGTMLLSGFMISARLPQLKQRIRQLTSGKLQDTYLPALRKIRTMLGKWLLAQLKLSSVTFSVLLVGFFLLKIPYAPVWALCICLVDALPILGTGAVLIPWSIVSLLQNEHLQAIGLLLTYGAAAMTRTVLEPRLIGSELGLDPLLTLISLYLGYRFWGIPGMLLAPLLAAAVKTATEGI